MCLLATVLLAPHVWALSALANLDAGFQAVSAARGRRRGEPELPYPWVGSAAGIVLACFVALLMPSVTAAQLLAMPATWALVLVPEWAWLVPATVARLLRARAHRCDSYDTAGAFSAR